MTRPKFSRQFFSSASGLTRFILPLPEICQDFLYHRVLDRWLNANKIIREAMFFDFTGYGLLPYASWPVDRKQELQRAFPFGYPFELQDPPSNQLALADDEFPRTVLTEQDAWRLYLNHVAQSLANDYWGEFPWRLEDLSDFGRALMLDGRAFFTRVPEGYEVEWSEAGVALPAPPRIEYDFLRTNNIIGSSRLDTIGRILDWCRLNLVHFTYGYEALNMEYQWQYRGLPPVSRMISGTPNDNPTFPDATLQHRTGGCHGTNGFLQAMLRVLNIPVRYRRPPGSGHATPEFVSEDLFLSHGDDPYNAYSRSTPPYAATELLIDHATYDTWFPSALSDPNLNVGRQVYELALVHLPNRLLQDHCRDLAAGRDHAASDVAAAFSRWYSVAGLEAQNLWARLDAKVTSFGGCAFIP